MEVSDLLKRINEQELIDQLKKELESNGEVDVCQKFFDEIDKWEEELHKKYNEVGEIDYTELFDYIDNMEKRL